MCAKFCYGMTVTLNAYNVVAARCAAEYLEMTEDTQWGNLVFKIEVFLNSGIFSCWKDSIIVLQTSKSLLPWCEDLKIIGRCIDSIACKTSVDPANIFWSYTYNRKLTGCDKIVEDKMKFGDNNNDESVPKDWWVEDICELDIDLYKRVMIAVKSKGRMDSFVIGEALKVYAGRWLPDSIDALVSDASRNKSLVETIVCLLPCDNGVVCSCSFLLKLLKVAIVVKANQSTREELMRRIGQKLHEACVKDLLIPSRSPHITTYDVDLVQGLLNQYMIREKGRCNMEVVEEKDKGKDQCILGHRSLLKVGKLVDGYLAEIAHDPNLSLSSFVDLSQSIPDYARSNHGGLYRAIDIYLKEHPGLTKAERKKLCGLMDVKKFTVDTCMHAAQNERLPLRVVVQVLFFEQLRASARVQATVNNSHDPLGNGRGKTVVTRCQSLNIQMSHLRIKDEELNKNNGKLSKKNSKNSRSGIQLLRSQSRRIFDKLWIVGKGHGENRSPETSGSNSPSSIGHGDTKSSGGLRHQRHSIS